MLKVLLIILSILKISAASNDQIFTCGKSSGKFPGTVIGETALSATDRGLFPWLVSLIRPDDSYFCGAVLISSNRILTAAHCIFSKGTKYSMLPREVRAVLGGFNLKDSFESGRTVSSIVDIKVHDDWSPNTAGYDGDLAVLLTEYNIRYTNYIRPICVITKYTKEKFSSVNHGILVGYGLSSADATAIEITPRIIEIPIHSKEDCVLHNKELTEKTFCAGSADGTGICQSDSGAGLYVEKNGIYYLRGIASPTTNDRKCDVNNYAAFTDVTDYEEKFLYGSSSCTYCSIKNRTGYSYDMCIDCTIQKCDYCIYEHGFKDLPNVSLGTSGGACIGCDILECTNCGFGVYSSKYSDK